MDEMNVPAPVLLKGSWYSLEQCGHLLRGAATLYRANEYSTAVGVAMLAREELGKYGILLDEWKKSIQTGKSPSMKHIRNACEDHIEKQKRGQLSVTLMTQAGSAPDNAVRTLLKSIPGTTAYEIADKILQRLSKAKSKRTPIERHEKRLKSFFVDLEDSGADWKRPSRIISQEEAYRLLNEAATDYSGQRDRFLTPGVLEDLQLVDALEAWSDKPDLPAPARPG
jgi:AbiV family abortive infection protein